MPATGTAPRMADAVRSALADFPFDAIVTASSELVEGQDWNAEWERNYFKPIVVGDRCVVHSSFHTDVPTAEFDIVIDPKMAFKCHITIREKSTAEIFAEAADAFEHTQCEQC